MVEIAPFSEMSQILFLETFTVVPALTEMPRASGEIAPAPDSVRIVFPETLVVFEPAT